jgi:hypothetical protein
MRALVALLLCAAGLHAAGWQNLFHGKNLDGWEVRGESQWTFTRDGVLLGQRILPHGSAPFGQWPLDRAAYGRWMNQQSWIYTKAEFGEFDLRLEYLLPVGGNSGVSIRDTSRARYSYPPELDPQRTPSHIGYEIQIIDSPKEKYPTGSIYLFAVAKTGMQRQNDWNTMEIEARKEKIRVRLNGILVAESAGDPKRALTGPIGLQLHDRYSWAMFRNVKIRKR